MLQDSEVSNSRMRGIIEKDQVITAKILKLVNFPFYSYRTRIADISQALMILGFNTIRNSVATIAAVDIFRMKEKYKNFDIKDLWKQSLAWLSPAGAWRFLGGISGTQFDISKITHFLNRNT
jgi:HD-like signal output (HDOD) protein